MDKKILRKKLVAIRDSISQEERKLQGDAITHRILSLEAYAKADVVLAYASFRSEADTRALIEQSLLLGKSVFLPKVEGQDMNFYQINSMDELHSGAYGILEPTPDDRRLFVPSAENPSLVLVPGVAFDTSGNRMGYGGGFYDRFFAKMEQMHTPLYKIGVAFTCQIVEEGTLITEEHDIKMDMITG